MKMVMKLCWVAVLIVGLLQLRPAHAQGGVLREADAAWNEKSYVRVLELYRKALASNSAGARREDVEYRVAVSLGKTEQWDAAIAAGNAFLPTTVWKARVLYWIGRLYTQLPHQGYKVGGKIYRGADYPKTNVAEKPQQVWLGEEDARQTLDYFEQAKIRAQQEDAVAKRGRFYGAIYPLPSEDEISLNFDLAAYLPTREYPAFLKLLEAKKPLNETVDMSQPYNRAWPLPNKILYLYNDISKLDQSANKHRTALAILAKGMFVRAYRQQLDAWANQWDAKQQKNIVRPYPFNHLEAIPIWQSLVNQFSGDAVADRTEILIGETYEGQGNLVKALATYQTLLDKFPHSKWVSDAQGRIQNITRHEIAVDSMGAQPPGVTAKLTISTRNVKRINFAAYPVKLENALTQATNLSSPNTQFTQFTQNFGAIGKARQGFGPPAATWSVDTKDKGDYQGVSETIDTPLKARGAYVIVGQSGNLRVARVLLISDLAILKKVDRTHALAYIADAKTGKPLMNAHVIIKETYNENSTAHTDIAQGVSDAQGFFSKQLVRGRERYSNGIQVLAWVDNRYAMTAANNGGYWNEGDNADEYKVYSYTDRPVYRPGQKVYFRQILSSRTKGGDQQPAKGVAVKVTVNNPKGETIYQKTLTSSEFGTINGELTLPTTTPLGEYSVNAEVPKSEANVAASGGNRFRVEEYKRPEFQISVVVPPKPARPGETVAARINAKYYFGSPVPDATVKYTVRRSAWWADYHFPNQFDWLYSYWGVGDYNTGRRNIGGEGSGTIVQEGTAKTDAQGNAEVSFQTTRDPQNINPDEWWRAYSNPLYTIEAEVTDASRRTIDGQGAVKVANQQYFAFLNAKQGYYIAGDRAQIEIETRDANDQPISAAGKMVVYKLDPGDKEHQVFSEAIETDKMGRAFWTWPTDATGNFRIAYEATDAWGQKVVASTNVWVGGPGLDTTQFRLQGVTIVVEKHIYAEGDTLKALLIADQPNTTVLLTQETGNDIIRRDLITIEGKSKEITIPIRHQHVPNFAIAAALVKNFEVYQAQQEVFVPPVKALLKVSAQGDKAEYKPGEKGTFTLHATDWQGKPARAELSLALTDASLFYIQKDYAPDIRTFYYGERRSINVNLDSYRSGQQQPVVEDDTKYPDYPAHGWELPDDLGMLHLDPGGGWGYYSRRYGTRLRARHGMAMAGAPGMMDEDASSNATLSIAKAAAPASPMAMAGSGAKLVVGYPKLDSSGSQAQLAPAQVRSNFAETAFWSPAVVTEGGTAKVEVTFPDSLTQWHAAARGLTDTAQVGAGESDVETRKNLLVRLQAPRFFVERDQVVLTANVHNYLKTAKRVKVALQTGDTLKLAPVATTKGMATGTTLNATAGYVEIKAGEEARVNWIVDVAKEGAANVQMTAQTDEESDAVKMSFPVLVHGVQRFTAQSGVLRQGGPTRQVITINMPKARRAGASTLNAQFNPSFAATMLDALPYLADYPYGCVEQTMSRFLPSVVAAKVLNDSGVNLQTLRTRATAYAAEAKAQPIGERIKNTGYTYPTGMPNSRNLQEMASRMWYWNRANNPIYDKKQLDDMVHQGLLRLYDMQRGDGGWGWWPGSAASDEYMTAYVVYGLATARASEVRVRDDVLARGYAYLAKQMKQEDNLHLLTAMAYSLSLRGKLPADAQKIVSGRLFTQRERLTAYSKSLLAMTLWNSGDRGKASVVIRNIENTAKVDAANGTAHWKQGNEWWYWWNDDVETNAVALRAFLQIDPKNRLVPMMMRWLTTQARGNHWTSTKSTAMVVYALADYVRINKELDVNYTLTVRLNNKVQRTYHVTSENALYFDNRFIVGDLLLQDGPNQLTIEKQGRGNLYWSAASEYFSLEEPIKAAGNKIAIHRRYFKLTRNPAVKPEQGDASKPRNGLRRRIIPRPHPNSSEPPPPEYLRTELKDGDALKSGDLVEVELILDAANDYEYLVFEDMKAAGLEPVDLRSGSAWGDGLSSNVELRDTKVAFFVDNLTQGTHVLRYRMHAEIPGRFHALPTNGYAMYAPEVRAISNEQRMGVHD